LKAARWLPKSRLAEEIIAKALIAGKG
jgi:hypothetical protein